jgi:hypothetical protein
MTVRTPTEHGEISQIGQGPVYLLANTRSTRLVNLLQLRALVPCICMSLEGLW